MTKTLHVYPSNGAWSVKREGQRAETFGTKQEAVAHALRNVKKAKAAQIVVHGKDGRVIESRTHGMQKIYEHPKKSRLASRKIATAVGKVVLDRVLADGLTRGHAPQE